MARPRRPDPPGTWYHVMNRGVARRTLFELAFDVQCFLDLLGEACERGDLEVHAYCVMTTHYHLLVRSSAGRMSYGMQQVQTGYSRWFNRSRRRDGPLVRGRYLARPVGSLNYRHAVVAYMDRNPTSAGLVTAPADYPHGSARHYVRPGAKSPTWLNRSWVEGAVRRAMGKAEYEPANYAKVFHSQSPKLDSVVESRLHSKATANVLDNLIDDAPEQTLRWMRQKAELADGTTPGLALVPIEAVIDAVQKVSARDFAEARPGWTIARRPVWAVMEVGLARQLTSDILATIGNPTGQSISQVDRWTRLHTEWVLANQEYAEAGSSITQVALGCWRVCSAWEERA